jgi:hypothetical protein
VIGITGGEQLSLLFVDGNSAKADHIPEKVDVNPFVHADVDTEGYIRHSEIGDPESFNLGEFHDKL